MAQYIKQGNIFGRVGSGVGKGLAEQLPKEIERGRLQQGLAQFEKDAAGLNPLQQGARIAAIPGIRPQTEQTLGELAKQQAYLGALKNQYEVQGDGKGYTPTQEEVNTPLRGEVPTLGTAEDTEQSYKSFIPPTDLRERAEAYENFQKNPARYNHIFDNALAERKAITTRNSEIQKAHQEQERIAVEKEKQLKSALDVEKKKLGLNSIPPKTYQKFEEKVLNAVLSKKDGGEGLTQEQAVNKYSKDMELADRDHKDLSSLSAWSPRDFNSSVNALQKSFSSRGDNQQMRDQLISDYGLSPWYASHRAYPVNKGEVPTLERLGAQTGLPGSRTGISFRPINDGIYSKLKEEMGDRHSPLSIAYEMDQRGEDGRAWLKYLNKNRDELKGWQIEELSKNTNIINLKDLWLRAWEK